MTSRFIESKLKENETKDNLLYKLLFLGSGGSGKSTFFRQLQYSHGDGFGPRDILEFKSQIQFQTLSEMQRAVKYYLSEEVENKRLQDSINRVTSYRLGDEVTSDMIEAIQYIWKNDVRLEGIFNKYGDHKVLSESTEYFWNALDRIKDPQYEPTRHDILMLRNVTVGMNEKQFDIKGMPFLIVDVGGQKSERKKWFNFFSDVRVVVFVVSLSCYNESMYEDYHQNAMVDAAQLFDATIHDPIFAETDILLFLNKKDLFETKIAQVPLTACPIFADFETHSDPKYIKNNPHDYTQCVSYIERKFKEMDRFPDKRAIDCHITCAVNKTNIENVFDAIVRSMKSEMVRSFRMS